MDNYKKVILAILAINITAVIYFGISIKRDIEFMKKEYASLHTNLKNQVILQGNEISNTVASSITQSNSAIQHYSFDVGEVNYEDGNGNAAVTLYLNLKQMNVDSQLLAEFNGLETNNKLTIQLDSMEQLTYQAQFNISILENYSVYIYEHSHDGGRRLLNEQAIPLLLYDDYYTYRVQLIGSGTSTSDEKITVHYEFKLQNGEQDSENIDKVMLHALNKNLQVIAEYDITDQLVINHVNPNVQAKYQVALAAGEITTEMSIDEFQTQYGIVPHDGMEASSYYFFEKTINKDSLGENWNDNLKEVYFIINIHFKDGMIFEL